MEKGRRILLAVMAACWSVYTVATLLGADIIYNVFSPLTGLAAIGLTAAGFRRMGRYRVPAGFFILGIGFWLVADLILFYYTYADPAAEAALAGVTDSLYLAPNYCFGAGLTAYMIADFKRKDIFRLLIDTFIIGVAGFVFVQKLYAFGFGKERLKDAFSAGSMLYLVAVTYVIVLMFMILTIRDLKSHTKAGFMIFGALLVYNFFEMRYTYRMAGGLEPESIFIDILYMACVCMIAAGLSDPSIEKALKKTGEAYEVKPSVGVGWVSGILLAAATVILRFAGILSENEFYLLLFSTMAYLIMWKTQQSSELTAQLLAKEQEENAKLGEWVDYQNQELKVANEQLERVSYKDALTGLYNRKYSRMYMNQILMDDASAAFAIFSMDLNHFKSINDTHGHATGDRILTEVAHRLGGLENENCMSFRIGGDEFMLVQKGFESEEDLRRTAERMREIFDRRITLDGQQMNVSISIGIASYPRDAQGIGELYKYADAARRAIKHRHSRTAYKFYDNDTITQISKRRRLETKLQNVNVDRDFLLYYQPQVEAKSGRLIGMEALIRWNDPEDGFISPGLFIPLAEEMGLMGSIGEWVNRTAMRQIREWNGRFGTDLVVGINVSPLQMKEEHFAEDFLKLKEETGVPSAWLDVEVTEGVAMEGSGTDAAVTEKLREAGLTFSVDDFGTGYATFVNMLEFSFDRIKIAKELVDDLTTNRNAYAVVRAITMMAKDMGLKTIAEGVEDKAQLDILIGLGCDQIQGYYFGKPLPPEEFEDKWLRRS